MPLSIIALTTDFGADSPYVAQMKGVLLSVLGQAQIIDVTHSISRHSVRHAQVVLRDLAFWLPLGTVHIVVVDPGVGTNRRGLALQVRGMTFVGPDNGIFTDLLQKPDAKVVKLDRSEFYNQPLSNTFHGRDIFAPIAAELAGGLSLSTVGTQISDPVLKALPAANVSANAIQGEVLSYDFFGNLITNISGANLGPNWTIQLGKQRASWVDTYHHGEHQKLLALVGSDGYLELAIRDNSAQTVFGVKEGTKVLCSKDKKNPQPT